MTTSTRNPRRCLFPALASFRKAETGVQTCTDSYGHVNRPLESLKRHEVSQWLDAESTNALSLLRVAWAVVLRSYTAGDHVCFRVQGRETKPYEAHITGSTVIRQLLHDETDSISGCTCGGMNTNGGDWVETSNTCIFVTHAADQTNGSLSNESVSDPFKVRT